MSTTNMPNFFDNILDDGGIIGELPELDQVPEFIDEPNLSQLENNAQLPSETNKRNSSGDLTERYDIPILADPSDESVLDKLASEVLSDGFPTFGFDTTIKENEVQDIALENALNEADNITNECEKVQNDGEKRSGDALGELNVDANENTNENRDPPACSDLCCKENVPHLNGAVKRRKSAGRKMKGAKNKPSRKPRAEQVRNTGNPRVSDVTASSATNRIAATSDANSPNFPTFQRSLGRELVGHVHPNNMSATNTSRQSLQVDVTNNSCFIVPAPHGKPPSLALASHLQPTQERSALSPQDPLSPASPLGMLPGDVRDQLLTQARHQSYAAAEMRAIIMAQEAASNMYRKASSGEVKNNPVKPNMLTSSAGVQRGQSAAMQPVAQLAGAIPRASSSIPLNTPTQSRQTSLRSTQPQQQVTPNQVPVSSHMHATQMHRVSNALPPQAVPFPRVSSADSHAKQVLLQQHPNAMGLSTYINNPNRNLRVHANPGPSINNNESKQAQTAPFPIFDTKLAAINGVPTVGPSGMRRASKAVRHSEVVAQTLANTYDQVNKLSANTVPGGRASRKPRLPNREQIGTSSSEELPVSQHKPQQQVQATAIARPDAPSASAPTASDQASAQLTAAAVRRQLSQNRNGPRLRFSKNAGPSKYCHICGRSASTVGVAVCGNLPLGLCRKVLCDKCLLIHEPEKLEMAKTKNSGWTCTHCRNCCPPKARCHQYTRNNQKRREKNDEKKRMKRKLQEQQTQQEQESKRKRPISSEQPDEQGQGISPTGVSDGTFG